MDILEDLSPANVHSEASLQKLSHEDFQKLLSGWFENSGLITETRSYLRMQLIRMLNTTKLGMQTNRPIEPASPKVQMLNMLLAEHLLQYKYFYTLSMFSNELTVLNIPPDFNFIFITDTEGEKRFKRGQILKITHFFNISIDEADFEDLVIEYDNDEDKKSFLWCLLEYLIEKKKQLPDIDDADLMFLLEQLRQNLEEVKVPTNKIRKIEKNIKAFFSLFEQKIKSDPGRKQTIARTTYRESKMKKSKQNEEESNAQRKMKLISVHDGKGKMIERVHKYHITRITKLQRQLDKKLKDMEKMRRKQQDQIPEKCSLKHCDEYCQETLNALNTIKLENDKLNKLIKVRDSQIKKLTLKMAELITGLEVAQSRLNQSSLQNLISAEDVFLSSEDEDSSVKSEENEKNKDEDIEKVFADIAMKLDELDHENEVINTEYSLFRKAGLPTIITT